MASNLTRSKPPSMASTPSRTSSKPSPAKPKNNKTRPSVIHISSGHGSDSSSSSRQRKPHRSFRGSSAFKHSDLDTDDDRSISLPRSAPAKSFLTDSLWDMPATSTTPARDPLTWQQNLLSSAKGHKKQDSAVDMAPDRPPSDSMTWQQQLLSSTPSSPNKSPSKKGNRGRRAQPRSEEAAAAGQDPGSDENVLKVDRLSLSEPFTIDDLFSTATTPSPTKSAPPSSNESPTKPTFSAQKKRPKSDNLHRSNSAGPAPVPLARVAQRDASTVSLPGAIFSSTPSGKYAGPEFHNSPSAHTLPTPSLLRGVKAA